MGLVVLGKARGGRGICAVPDSQSDRLASLPGRPSYLVFCGGVFAALCTPSAGLR